MTATGGTLISNGITTVHTTRVFGTYLNGGQYAQIVQSTAKVFEDDIVATPVVGFEGSVQHVTERPSFGLEASSDPGPATNKRPRNNDNLPLESLFGDHSRNSASNSITVLDEENDEDDQSPTGLASRIRQRLALKKTKQQEFKARLKNRFERFKTTLQSEEQQQTPRQNGNIGRGSVSQISLPTGSRSSSSSFGRSSFRQGRRERFRSRESVPEQAPQEVIEEVEVATTGGRSRVTGGRSRFRDRIRGRVRPSNQVKPVAIELQQESVEDLLGSPSVQHERNSGFGTRGRTKNRFRDRISPAQTRRVGATSAPPSSFKASRPKLDFTSSGEESSKPLTFKKFNRFNRPDFRQSLLEKILNKGKGKNTLDPEEQAELIETQQKEEPRTVPENESGDLPEYDFIEEIDANDVDSDPLQTTLQVSTMMPEDKKATSTYLRIATIRSPYSFSFEDGMSTRFITVTR